MWTESQVVNRWIEATAVETELKTFRSCVLRLLNNLGEPVPPALIETINTQTSLSLLQDWFDIAMNVESIQEFIAALR